LPLKYHQGLRYNTNKCSRVNGGDGMKVVNKPIEMIAHNKPDGSIRPLRFRLQEEDELQVIKVDKIFASSIGEVDGNVTYIFSCMVAIHGINHMCEIRYDLMTTKWLLYKI